MLIHHLHGTNKAGGVVFLAGWGMDHHPFALLPRLDCDILLVSDYRELRPFCPRTLLNTEAPLHLVAWSMGVWVAATLFADCPTLFASATAINGTLQPIDARCGIAPGDYEQMLDAFSPEVLRRFRADMFTSPEEHALFVTHGPQRRPAELQEELHLLAHHYREQGPARNIFQKKIVGSQDRIMPARSQLRAWGREACVVIPEPHFPFYHWHGLYPPAHVYSHGN